VRRANPSYQNRPPVATPQMPLLLGLRSGPQVSSFQDNRAQAQVPKCYNPHIVSTVVALAHDVFISYSSKTRRSPMPPAPGWRPAASAAGLRPAMFSPAALWRRDHRRHSRSKMMVLFSLPTPMPPPIFRKKLSARLATGFPSFPCG